MRSHAELEMVAGGSADGTVKRVDGSPAAEQACIHSRLKKVLRLRIAAVCTKSVLRGFSSSPCGQNVSEAKECPSGPLCATTCHSTILVTAWRPISWSPFRCHDGAQRLC